MSNFVIQRMDHMLERLCIANNTQHVLDSTDARDRALKPLIPVATDMAEKDFAHHGVGKHYCLSFLEEEWGSFFFSCTAGRQRKDGLFDHRGYSRLIGLDDKIKARCIFGYLY
jgi:hypothetical protein